MMKEAKDLDKPNIFTKADRINRTLNEVLSDFKNKQERLNE